MELGTPSWRSFWKYLVLNAMDCFKPQRVLTLDGNKTARASMGFADNNVSRTSPLRG
jgi:hypothetical protein